MKHNVIFGAGAIGGSMGAYLARSGFDVLFVDQAVEHVDAINSNGLTIEGIDGEFTVSAPAVLPSELKGPLDVVFLAVKSQHTAAAMEVIAPLLADDGFVVSLQNGINEYTISEYIGADRTIGAFVNWAADYISPGRIKFGGKSNFIIGELNGVLSPRLLTLQKDLQTFLSAQVTNNIMGYLWSKQVNISVMFATGMTPLSIAEGLEYPDTQDVYTALALEAMQVPEALGVVLEAFDDFDPGLYRQKRYGDALKKTADHYRHMLKNRTGLYRDLAIRKRPSEIDGTVGHTVIKGEELGLALPCNKRMVELVHEIEKGHRSMGIENVFELKKNLGLKNLT